ncbi:hypothetical protein HJC10_35625 [Corallococcus exiguus]|uniref:hypothetical protein n=1 Tax=Corallococcus TaxID=83461 RepID=UPI000EE4C233|nr:MULTISPECIES: hypothetical protein [Corallococcus]NNB89758.1 hypothetical protein [Corallococcus exiguus]NNB98386.1 hypothetical protein [Corallococcus exiguus]NNC08156.1 hypothetical protein [Corallococcus exiguus]NPC52036.1 hypothetical protein [Corallococcus exiguus]RKH86210.1 hypothetical protein D7X99_03525 [Corallococcus sp. AB032C]
MYENVKGRSPAASIELASSAKSKFDEFLRRQLGVSDARDPKAVVGALRKLYPTTAARLDDESKGQPIRVSAMPEPAMAMMNGTLDSPGQRRFRQERKALVDDLEIAVNLASNRDFKAPICGWRDSILAEVDEGEAAANMAVDPVSRDRAFYSIRKLGDTARVARLVGMVNPTVVQEFGRLAATIDDNATLLRILAGEALFRAGFDKGGTVFQVALQDLRQRREALINSLEQLTATSIQEGYDDWGDGQASYGKLLDQLRARGQSDLRAIARPDAMSRLLDVLLNHTPRQNSEDMRGIASAVPVELIQLRRLRDVAGSLLDTSITAFSNSGGSSRGVALNAKVQGASAPLAAFTEALTLFIDAFDRPNAGARLLNLVLPVPLTFRDLTGKEQELNDKFRDRNDTQELIEDLLMDPSTSVEFWKELARLDRKLYHIDRIIDLFLLDYDEAVVPGGNRVDLHEEMIEQLDDNVDVFNVSPAFLREQCGLEEDSLELANTLTQEAPGQAEEIEDDRNHKYGFPQGGHCNTGEPFTVPPPIRVSLDRIEKDLEPRINPGAVEHPMDAEPGERAAPATATAGNGASLDDVASLIEKSRSRIMTDVKQQLEAQGPELARQLETAFSDQLKAVERIIAGKGRHGSDGQPAPPNGHAKSGHSRRHVRHARKP